MKKMGGRGKGRAHPITGTLQSQDPNRLFLTPYLLCLCLRVLPHPPEPQSQESLSGCGPCPVASPTSPAGLKASSGLRGLPLWLPHPRETQGKQGQDPAHLVQALVRLLPADPQPLPAGSPPGSVTQSHLTCMGCARQVCVLVLWALPSMEPAHSES